MPPPRTSANKDGSLLAEQFYGQVSETVQQVLDSTSRMDERIKMVMERQRAVDAQIDKVIESQQSVLGRLAALESEDIGGVSSDIHNIGHKIAVLEADQPETKREIAALKQKQHDFRNVTHALEMKVEALGMRMGNHDGKWLRVFDGVWKVALALIAGYILYKLGLH